jgi:hypothetical protein
MKNEGLGVPNDIDMAVVVYLDIREVGVEIEKIYRQNMFGKFDNDLLTRKIRQYGLKI